jgi:alkylhydroperoxidase family enzyme
MPRIQPLEPPYPPEIQAHFDQVMKGAPPLTLFTTIASSSRAWMKFRSGSLLDGRLLTLRQREIVINRVSARAGCEYEWGVHVTAFAAAAGLSHDDVRETLRAPASLGYWAPDEAALIAAIDALHERSTLSAKAFADLRTHFKADQILEILMLAGFYRMVAYIANGLDIPLESTAARFRDYVA